MNTANESFFTDSQEDDFDILGYVYKYLRYWYWFVLSVLLCLVIAYVNLKRITPIYKVYATLLIKDELSPKKADDIVADFSATGTKRIENEIALLKSRSLVGKVIDDLNLTVSYWTEARSRDVELYSESPIKLIATDVTGYGYGNPLFVKFLTGNKFELFDPQETSLGVFRYGMLVASPHGRFRIFRKSNKPIAENTQLKVIFSGRDGVIDGLISSISISQINEYSSFLSLSVNNSLTDKGKDILASLLDAYAATSLEDKNREATSTLRFIEERLKLVTTELGNVEQDVEKYRQTRGIIDLSAEATLFLEKVGQNDAKINEIDIQLKVLESIERYINGAQIGTMAPATLMVSDPVLNSYIVRLAELETERNKLVQSVRPGNTYLETINTQMAGMKQSIKENLANQRENMLVVKQNLLANNSRLDNAISSVPKKERQLVDIKRQAGIKENIYLMLLQKREETALSYASTVTDSRVVDAPYTSGGQISPNRQSTFLSALLIGLLIPFCIISVKEFMTTTVQVVKEIEQKSGLKVFGKIGINPKQNGPVIDLNDRSLISEQIRIIRSNLQYLFMDDTHQGAHTILITSSTSGEGKSFVGLNMAASLAALDKKVIILGLDMRRPNINQYLNVSNKTGVSNYLIGRAFIDDITQVTSIENVFMIPSGPIPPNPSELLANGRIKTLIDELRATYDYILLDTPPLSLVTDASLLAPYVEVCFYIVRYAKTPRAYLKHIADLNAQKIFKSLHIIFNGVNYKKSPDYGYRYGQEGYYKGVLFQNK